MQCKACGAELADAPDLTQHFQESAQGRVTKRGVIEKRKCEACGEWNRTYIDKPLPTLEHSSN